jgi:hypothetical protein
VRSSSHGCQVSKLYTGDKQENCERETYGSRDGLGRSQIIQHRESLVRYKSFNTLCPRDIRAGEVIFTDVPGAVGPDNNPKPVCLTCYKRLPGLIYR